MQIDKYCIARSGIHAAEHNQAPKAPVYTTKSYRVDTFSFAETTNKKYKERGRLG